MGTASFDKILKKIDDTIQEKQSEKWSILHFILLFVSGLDLCLQVLFTLSSLS